MQPAAARHQDSQREVDYEDEEKGRNQQRQGLQERRPQAQRPDEVEAGRTEGRRPQAARGVPGQASQSISITWKVPSGLISLTIKPTSSM